MERQTDLDIGTIGQKLQAARMKKGVTPSVAGEATRILSKYIVAMEADEFETISAPVYVKGFIRMYAQYLGIDSGPLVEEYTSKYAPKPNKKQPLVDEVKQSLAMTDQGDAVDLPIPSAPPKKNVRRNVFSDVHSGKLGAENRSADSGDKKGSGMAFSMPNIPIKTVSIAAGTFVLLLVVFAGVKQCSSNESEPEVATGGAAALEQEVLFDSGPDVFLEAGGSIEVNP